jgi:hypothetical protein
LFWNAANDYSKPYTAMPEMQSAKGRYFRGDEIPVSMQADLGDEGAPKHSPEVP